MIIRSFRGKSPKIAASALIADNVYIIGDVEIGEDCSLWPGVVVRGDTSSVRIGNNVHIEENTSIHTGSVIDDHVIIGHNCSVEGPVGHHTLISNTASVMPRATVGAWCTIGAGSVVLGGTDIPDKAFAFGVPAKVRGEVDIDDPKDRHNSLYYTEYMNELVAEYKKEGVWARGAGL